jgi:hypothetical protein
MVASQILVSAYIRGVIAFVELTFAAEECLDVVCRQSSKDATLLYACVLEAQNAGCKQQAIVAHQKVLQKYDYSAPAGVHLPALLR